VFGLSYRPRKNVSIKNVHGSSWLPVPTEQSGHHDHVESGRAQKSSQEHDCHWGLGLLSGFVTADGEWNEHASRRQGRHEDRIQPFEGTAEDRFLTAIVCVWLFKVVGISDVVWATAKGMSVCLYTYFPGWNWYILHFYVSMLIVTHVMIAYRLIKRRQPST
jgi:hypothetical protein